MHTIIALVACTALLGNSSAAKNISGITIGANVVCRPTGYVYVKVFPCREQMESFWEKQETIPPALRNGFPACIARLLDDKAFKSLVSNYP